MMVVLNLVGCASLHSRVFEQIHEGDSLEKVVGTLGQPEHFKYISKVNAMQYIYLESRDMCSIVVKDGRVFTTYCEENPGYVSAGAGIGIFLQGMGQGMQQNQTRMVNCHSYAIGNTVSTNCY